MFGKIKEARYQEGCKDRIEGKLPRKKNSEYY